MIIPIFQISSARIRPAYRPIDHFRCIAKLEPLQVALHPFQIAVTFQKLCAKRRNGFDSGGCFHPARSPEPIKIMLFTAVDSIPFYPVSIAYSQIPVYQAIHASTLRCRFPVLSAAGSFLGSVPSAALSCGRFGSYPAAFSATSEHPASGRRLPFQMQVCQTEGGRGETMFPAEACRFQKAVS